MSRSHRPRGLITPVEAAALQQLRCYSGRLDVADLECLATQGYTAARLCIPLPDPLWLIERLGVRHRAGHPWGCAGAMRLGNVIVYRRQARRAQGLALLHELAHWLLEDFAPTAHDDRDVWLLTLCLAFPLDELTRVREEGWSVRTLARHQRHVERWALRERAAMARELYRVQAA